jgi:uncharacterized protein with HEPN domain
LPPDDRIRIQHMIEAAESALGFVFGRSRGDLETDRMLLFALVRAIEIMGEAASRISAETRQATTEIPWPAVIGNRLVHAISISTTTPSEKPRQMSFPICSRDCARY